MITDDKIKSFASSSSCPTCTLMITWRHGRSLGCFGLFSNFLSLWQVEGNLLNGEANDAQTISQHLIASTSPYWKKGRISQIGACWFWISKFHLAFFTVVVLLSLKAESWCLLKRLKLPLKRRNRSEAKKFRINRSKLTRRLSHSGKIDRK